MHYGKKTAIFGLIKKKKKVLTKAGHKKIKDKLKNTCKKNK